MKCLVLGLVLLGLVGCKNEGLQEYVSVEPYIMCHPETYNHLKSGASDQDDPRLPNRVTRWIYGWEKCDVSGYIVRHKSYVDYLRRRGTWKTWHHKRKIHVGTMVFKIVDMHDPSKVHCEAVSVWDHPTIAYIDFRDPLESCIE